MRKEVSVLWAVVILGFVVSTFAQQQPQNADKVPQATTLLFREDFKSEKPGEVQLTQDAVINPNLQLKVYGPGSKPGNTNQSGLLLGNEEDPTKPGTILSIVWTGVVDGPWAVMLRDKNIYLDLRGTARIHWRIRPRGFHYFRPVIKLADGTMLAPDYAEPTSTYFRESEIYFVDIPRWRVLDPDKVAESRLKAGEPMWRTNVDLSKVDEIGFSDMMGGAGHGAFGNVAVDWMEVYGNPVKRDVSQSQAR
jgi:hypothetical protein